MGGRIAGGYRSTDEAWSFNALQRAVEHLPKDIYRAKGHVRLQVETDDYGVLQVTGRRGTLRLCEPDGEDAEDITTELVFIGKPGSITNDSIGALFEQSLEAARNQGDETYIVKDLRAFEVLFA